MNNFLSLYYFIPEFILLLNVFCLFFSSEIKQRHLLKIRQILIIVSLVTVVILILIRWFDHPGGLFYNSFVLDPFSNIFSIVLLFVFLVFELPVLWKYRHAGDTNDLLQKLIILIASILLVETNSVIGLLLCVGLIFIGNSMIMNRFSHLNTDNKQITIDLTIQILVFGLLFFGFAIVYGFTGTLNFQVVQFSVSKLSESPLNYCFLTLFLILGLGLYGIVQPFRILHEKRYNTYYTHYFGSSYFLPFIALYGSLIRILNGILPIIRNHRTFPDEYMIFVVGFSICLIAGANLYYFKKKTINDLFVISLIVHYGLIISSISVFTNEALTASIYSIISTTVILAGIILLQKSDVTSTQSKLIKTIFYLGLIGMPGTSGFTGRFLLLRALYNGGVPLWLIVLMIVSILPIIYFYTVEIISLYRTKTVHPDNNILSVPAFLALSTFLIVFYWEPFTQLITESLVFFN